MSTLQMYDLEINPAKMIKQKGLCLLEFQSNNLEQEHQWIQEEYIFADTIDIISAPSSEWYDDIKFYLNHGYASPTLDFKKHNNLRLKETPYQFIDNLMFFINYDGVFLRCLEKPEADNILFEMRAGPVGGNYFR